MEEKSKEERREELEFWEQKMKQHKIDFIILGIASIFTIISIVLQIIIVLKL